MPFKVCRFPQFDTKLKEFSKKYPLSSIHINTFINSLDNYYLKGVVYPGFANFQVRKIRLALKEYRISERKGLRLIYLVYPEKEMIVPLVIYKKGEVGSEKEVIAQIKHQLKKYLDTKNQM